MKFLSLETNERKNIALWMMFGGALVFTAYACVALWLVSTTPSYVFWLGVIAHVQIFSIMCGYIAQLVKRRISAGREGVTITDGGFEEDVQAKPEVAE
jgi:hypothetical protein